MSHPIFRKTTRTSRATKPRGGRRALVVALAVAVLSIAGLAARRVHGQESPHFRGDATCRAGESCTGCVADVARTFARLGAAVRSAANEGAMNVRGKLVYPSSLPPYGWGTAGLNGADHIQTVHAVRPFEVATGTDWVVIDSQNQRYAGGGETTFRRGLVFAKRVRGTNELRGEYFYPLQDAPHPGGVQVADRYLAVGSDCHRDRQRCAAFVDFFDVGDFAAHERETCESSDAIHCDPSTGRCTGKPCGPARFANRLYLDGSRGEPNQGPVTGRVSSVAFARLSDGRYFLYVSRRSGDADGWYYLSDSTRLGPETRWRYVGAHSPDDHRDRRDFDRWAGAGYQNVNFVTECGSGKLFLVGLGSVIDLYSLEPGFVAGTTERDSYSWVPSLERVQSTEDGRCTTREGAGVYVEPDGSMGLYCIEGTADRGADWALFRTSRDRRSAER